MRLSNADNCPEVGKFKPGLFSEISCETTATLKVTVQPFIQLQRGTIGHSKSNQYCSC